MNKSEQTSDWQSRPLRASQLQYAALDAAVLVDIARQIIATHSSHEEEDIDPSQPISTTWGGEELMNASAVQLVVQPPLNMPFQDALYSPRLHPSLLQHASEGKKAKALSSLPGCKYTSTSAWYHYIVAEEREKELAAEANGSGVAAEGKEEKEEKEEEGDAGDAIRRSTSQVVCLDENTVAHYLKAHKLEKEVKVGISSCMYNQCLFPSQPLFVSSPNNNIS